MYVNPGVHELQLSLGSLLRSAGGLLRNGTHARVFFCYQKSELAALFPVIPQLFRGDSVLLEALHTFGRRDSHKRRAYAFRGIGRFCPCP